MDLLVGTEGLLDLSTQPVSTPFGSELVHHGAVSERGIAVIVNRSEIWYNDGSWQQLVTSDLKLNCLLWVDNRLLVGTEGARIAWVDNHSLKFVSSFDEVDNRDKWSTPWGGSPDVRSLSLGANGTIYADIHVGWIVSSSDGGVSWIPRTQGLNRDVHQVSAHPTDPGVVAAATAGGFYLSTDSGLTFEKYWDLSPTYQRAVAWFADRDIVLCSVSSGPSGGRAKLYRSNNRGQQWEEVDLPAPIEDNINTYQITLGEAGLGYVIVNNRILCRTTDYAQSWTIISDNLPKTYQLLSTKTRSDS